MDFVKTYNIMLQTIQKLEPGLVALHCQEVGGKNYEDSMQHVNQFVKWVSVFS